MFVFRWFWFGVGFVVDFLWNSVAYLCELIRTRTPSIPFVFDFNLWTSLAFFYSEYFQHLWPVCKITVVTFCIQSHWELRHPLCLPNLNIIGLKRKSMSNSLYCVKHKLFLCHRFGKWNHGVLKNDCSVLFIEGCFVFAVYILNWKRKRKKITFHRYPWVWVRLQIICGRWWHELLYLYFHSKVNVFLRRRGFFMNL